MLPGSRFARLLWIMLLICAFLVFDHDRAEAEEGLASWYGPGFEGRPTASGVPYNPNGLTAAHKTLPLGTKLLVSYGDRTVPVTVTDRGPFTGNRELDLSQGAARELGLTQVGVDYVDYRVADGGQQGLPQGAAQQPGIQPAQQSGVPQGAAQQSPLPQPVRQPGLTPDGTEPGSVSGGYDTGYPGYPRSYPPAQEVKTNGGAYTVQPGDNLSRIAAQLGISADDLARYNGIADPNLIYSGQALYFPTTFTQDPSGASDNGTLGGGTVTQSPSNAGGEVTPSGGVLANPAYQGVLPSVSGSAAVPMAP